LSAQVKYTGRRRRHVQRLRILLVGHACAPDAGSEPGLTWNWARHLAVRHEVCVIAHPQHRDEVDWHVHRLGARAPRMVWVDLPERINPWNPAGGERCIHLHYVLWQRAALAQARRLHAERPFDLVHHVSWGTVNSAPQLWRLGVPFVWGPLGGGQVAPLRFADYLGLRGTLAEAARSVREALVPLLPSVKRAAANSALILATNRETAAVLYRASAPRVELFLDNGVLPEHFIARDRLRRARDRLELLWAGRLEARKALPLALEAMACARDLPVRLSVAGDGPLRPFCERRAAALGLSRTVRFLGMVPRTRVRELFATSDALLFTSLQDGFGSVVIEAMAAGLPVLGLDHQGVGALIPQQAAIKVPVTSPAATIHGLADGIRALAASPDLARCMGEAARRHATTESWTERVARMEEFYRGSLESRYGRTWISEDDRNRALLPEASA
jgi:glycosyltransferase involved in cell wall biosynthesis